MILIKITGIESKFGKFISSNGYRILLATKDFSL